MISIHSGISRASRDVSGLVDTNSKQCCWRQSPHLKLPQPHGRQWKALKLKRLDIEQTAHAGKAKKKRQSHSDEPRWASSTTDTHSMTVEICRKESITLRHSHLTRMCGDIEKAYCWAKVPPLRTPSCSQSLDCEGWSCKQSRMDPCRSGIYARSLQKNDLFSRQQESANSRKSTPRRSNKSLVQNKHRGIRFSLTRPMGLHMQAS